MSYADLNTNATAMKWSPNGDRLGVMAKGGMMHIFDPRKQEGVMTG